MRTPLFTRTGCLLLMALATLLRGHVVPAQETNRPLAEEESDPTTVEQVQPESTQAGSARRVEPGTRERRINRPAVVVIGRDAELAADDSTDAVVVVGGSAVIRGKVRDATVAVGGDITLKEGAEVNEAVAVLGGIKAESGSRIRGQAVSVGGKVEVEPGASAEGHIQDVDIGGIALPKPEWLREWFRHCVLGFRPLAPQVGWVWLVAFGWFLFYLLIAAAFPKPVSACVMELQRRPATTFALGILALLIAPLVFLLLAATGVGLFVVPFLLAAVAVAGIVGKVGLLEWLGLSLVRPFRDTFENPFVALLIGSVLLVVLYNIPVLGLLLFLITAVWGLGAAVAASFTGLRREMPSSPVTVPPSPVPEYGLATTPCGAPSMQDFQLQQAPYPGESAAETIPGRPEPAGAAFSATPAVPGLPPVLPDVLAFPRATFWERMGAGFLDMVLVSILGSIVGSMPLTLLIALAYFAGMWGWRATTIGGIVLGLKVVRVDSSPLNFAVAIVRGLAAAFSIVVLFLGFLWIAWDREKQGWHDRIAGTVVIKQPRAMPLVCI